MKTTNQVAGSVSGARSIARARLPQGVLRVITLEDRETIHNAFFDRGFSRRPE